MQRRRQKFESCGRQSLGAATCLSGSNGDKFQSVNACSVGQLIPHATRSFSLFAGCLTLAAASPGLTWDDAPVFGAPPSYQRVPPCPQGSEHLRGTDVCQCSFGFQGDVQRSQEGDGYSGHCSPTPCPSNAARGDYVGECKCNERYEGKLVWRRSPTPHYDGRCTLVPCPKGSEQVIHHRLVHSPSCNRTGVNASVDTAKPEELNASINCQHAEAGQRVDPVCRCVGDRIGSYVWDGEEHRYRGSCFQRNPCPDGYIGARIVTPMDADLEAHVGVGGSCSRAPCPAHASWNATRGLCECVGDVRGRYNGDLRWNASHEAYEGQCVPTLRCGAREVARMVQKDLIHSSLACVCDANHSGAATIWGVDGSRLWTAPCHISETLPPTPSPSHGGIRCNGSRCGRDRSDRPPSTNNGTASLRGSEGHRSGSSLEVNTSKNRDKGGRHNAQGNVKNHKDNASHGDFPQKPVVSLPVFLGGLLTLNVSLVFLYKFNQWCLAASEGARKFVSVEGSLSDDSDDTSLELEEGEEEVSEPLPASAGRHVETGTTAEPSTQSTPAPSKPAASDAKTEKAGSERDGGRSAAGEVSETGAEDALAREVAALEESSVADSAEDGETDDGVVAGGGVGSLSVSGVSLLDLQPESSALREADSIGPGETAGSSEGSGSASSRSTEHDRPHPQQAARS
eukprot:TRINITY_DN11276_c0_g1_i1.p1 TRINITY_DN11276_c0_g1~~TRINITY_DN11276_c0_g1_i1.p1  ORF type:complete len:682 (+),score=90.05 TRINITY_DN11276_c0_g1_i1:57-2102(+)